MSPYRIAIALPAVGLLVLADTSAQAAGYVVDTLSDSNLTACTGAPSDCSLRALSKTQWGTRVPTR